jgi:hypothetical protein
MRERVFHVSEEEGIEWFEPRWPPSEDSGVREKVVFGIGEGLLHHYLWPRDCPRVCFYAGEESDHADVERLMGRAKFVVAIEEGWVERVRRAELFCYRLPEEMFECVDEGAGYYVSRVGVAPVEVRRVEDCLEEMERRGVEVRVLETLGGLRDEVVGSTLRYSMIRMRNAKR